MDWWFHFGSSCLCSAFRLLFPPSLPTEFLGEVLFFDRLSKLSFSCVRGGELLRVQTCYLSALHDPKPGFKWLRVRANLLKAGPDLRVLVQTLQFQVCSEVIFLLCSTCTHADSSCKNVFCLSSDIVRSTLLLYGSFTDVQLTCMTTQIQFMLWIVCTIHMQSAQQYVFIPTLPKCRCEV